MIRVPAVIVGQSVGRIEVYSLTIVLDCFVEIALSIIGASSIVESCLQMRIKLNGPCIVVDSLF